MFKSSFRASENPAARPSPEAASGGSPSGHFPDTQWTALLKPVARRLPGEPEALERLFEIYRPAILAFIRNRVRDPQEAEDLAHDYIHRLLKSDDLASMDRSKGKFRSFLIVSIKHFLANHYTAHAAQKRGGGAVHVPVDDHAEELAAESHEQDFFMSEWVAAIHQEVLRSLRAEWEKVGKGDEFTEYEPFIWEKKGEQSRDELAARHRLTVNALNVRIARLRERYKALLREVVAQTVRENEVDEEIRNLTARILAPDASKAR